MSIVFGRAITMMLLNARLSSAGQELQFHLSYSELTLAHVLEIRIVAPQRLISAQLQRSLAMPALNGISLTQSLRRSK